MPFSSTKLTPIAGFDVTISGATFSPSSSAVCFIDNQKVALVFVSSVQVVCSIPGSSKLSLNVAVSQNGVQSSNSLIMLLTDPVSIAAVYPTWGSSSFNSLVTLIGRGFQANMSVYFGRTPAFSATFLSESRMIIVCSPRIDGIVSLPASLSNGQLVASLVSFKYMDLPLVDNLTPTVGSHRGGTTVIIWLKTDFIFLNQSAISCMFGSSSAAVKQTSNTSLSCVTPAASPLIVPFRVVVESFALNSQKTLFYEFKFASVSVSIRPSVVAAGYASQITLSGSFDLQSLSTSACVIRSAFYIPSFASAVYIKVTSSSGQNPTCTLPALSKGNYSIYLSLDGVESEFFCSLVNIDPPVLSSLYPTVGIAAGGDMITIFGALMPVVGSFWLRLTFPCLYLPTSHHHRLLSLCHRRVPPNK